MRAAELVSPYRFFLKELDAPGQISRVKASLAKYTGEGKEPRLADNGPAMESGRPESQLRVGISIAVGFFDPPVYHPQGAGLVEAISPGTGSTFIGLAILTHGNGKSFAGNGYSVVIPHKDIDLSGFNGPFDCAKLPFAIETEMTFKDHAIPVFAWFPRNFDLSLKRDKLPTKDLPKGTIIVYAAIN